MKNSIDTALERGREEGRAEGLVKGREEGLVKGREEGLVKGREEGLVKGREEGRAEGERNAKVQMALSLLSLGVPTKTIAEASGLAEEDIEMLRGE